MRKYEIIYHDRKRKYDVFEGIPKKFLHQYSHFLEGYSKEGVLKEFKRNYDPYDEFIIDKIVWLKRGMY